MKFIVEFTDIPEDEPGFDPRIARTNITTTLEEPEPQTICDGDCGGFAAHSIEVKDDPAIQNYCEEHIGWWLVSLLQPDAATWDSPHEFGEDDEGS